MSDPRNAYGVVISGHGRFNEEYLDDHPTERRKKSGTFAVPTGMTVVMYAPPGAYLDNAVANLIETGNPPAIGLLELKQVDSSRVQSMPSAYPWSYTAGQPVINYTVRPPEGLTIKGTPITVETPTSLRVLVDNVKTSGQVTVHYACCSSGYSDKRDFADLFPYKGYYARLK